jgi:hypothetical protein
LTVDRNEGDSYLAAGALNALAVLLLPSILLLMRLSIVLLAEKAPQTANCPC